MSMLRTLLRLAATAMIINLAMATNFMVGGPTGAWDMTTNLQSWASSQVFIVGDNLICPTHNVFEVSKMDYDSCQSSNPIQNYSGGITPIPLISPGRRYFICGATGHCSQGMKVEISTLAASATPPASPPASLAPSFSPVIPPASLPLTDMPASSPISLLSTEMPTPQPPILGGPTLPHSVPLSESPASSTLSSVFSPPPPSFSSATKVIDGLVIGFTFVTMVLLFV